MYIIFSICTNFIRICRWCFCDIRAVFIACLDINMNNIILRNGDWLCKKTFLFITSKNQEYSINFTRSILCAKIIKIRILRFWPAKWSERKIIFCDESLLGIWSKDLRHIIIFYVLMKKEHKKVITII